MLLASRQRLVESLPPDAEVLDIGGWADPLNRADWVMDVLPYESRGFYQRQGWAEPDPEPQRFKAETWIQRDICDREPFPFADDQIDFVVCAHTLEDVRDPLWVCAEMSRVARAGYVEVPSMLDELSYGFRGPFVGWEHHRWLTQVHPDESRLEFTFKEHGIHADPDAHFPAGFRDRLSEEERVVTLWWEGRVNASERSFIGGSLVEDFLKPYVAAELARRERGGLRRLLGRR
jgi:hypothetical protein